MFSTFKYVLPTISGRCWDAFNSEGLFDVKGNGNELDLDIDRTVFVDFCFCRVVDILEGVAFFFPFFLVALEGLLLSKNDDMNIKSETINAF